MMQARNAILLNAIIPLRLRARTRGGPIDIQPHRLQFIYQEILNSVFFFLKYIALNFSFQTHTFFPHIDLEFVNVKIRYAFY